MRTVRALVEGEPLSGAGRGLRLLVGPADDSVRMRYGVALGLAVAAVAVASLLPAGLQGYRVLVYLAAVSLAALRGGSGPGLAALAPCAVAYAAALGAGLARSAPLEEPDPLHRLVFFAGFAALGVWAASAVREGYRHTHARRRRAEARADAQRVAAELGVRALAESDLDALLVETLGSVQQALRCDSVTLLELVPERNALRLREVAGVGRALVGHEFDADAARLAFAALSSREPIAVDDLRDEPSLASPALLQHGMVSSLVAPVVAPGPRGRSFGVVGAHTRARRPFGADEASFLQTAANVVGTAMVRLRSEERVRQTLASERFLADASRQLALSIDWQETLARVARLAVPFLGDWCLVVVVDDAGQARSVAAAAADPGRAAAARELLERYPIDLAAPHGVGRILRTGEPELMPEVSADDFVGGDGAELRREILRRLGMRSYIGAPLVAGERVLGAVAFGVADGPRRFGPDDLALAQALAQRCALALENARLYRAAQEATRAREEVLAVVSHDLKTPLGALRMGAQMVERLAPAGREGDDLRRAATAVRRTSERMGRLIHDLVDTASLDAGRPSLRLAEHDAAGVAREAVDGVQALAQERGVSLTASGAAAAPICCDRDRILQVLSNLLANAVQVTEHGGAVSLAVARSADEVTFTVRDSGPGISPEDLPRIFERWYRGRRARYPGSGLGLAIARTIVEGHRGRIWAESTAGAGSAFHVALPTSQATGEARAR